MSRKEQSLIPADKIELYDQLIATVSGVERKGATMPYTALNGHMFSFLDKEGSLGLRLPAEEREVFLRVYKSALCKSHGAVLKEYVLVPPALFENTTDLKKYFRQSMEYVLALKPKKK